jgi:C1A family cysteine protease
MFLIVLLAVAGVFCEEMLVTKEYTDYLKRHVDWEVVDYEENIFRGWTVDEVKALLMQEVPEFDEALPVVETKTAVPSSLVWGASCIHEVRNQASCGSCWAFATAGMLSDRCCLHSGKDHGWLSPQELVNCDKQSHGCQGGWPSWALEYIIKAKGLTHDACVPYTAKDGACPKTCADGKDFIASHVCNCHGPKQCVGVDAMKTCLQTGPISVAFYVPRSFMNYKSGIYKCDGSSLGLHAVNAIGYSDDPECYWIIRNSWGTSWGMNGYVHIACQTCGIHGTYPNGNVMCEKVE